jgi:hypothetical protein
MRTFIGLLLSAVLCSCASTAPSASVPGSPTGSPGVAATASATASANPAQADLDSYLENLERTHPEPFHGVSRDAFVAKLDDVKAHVGDRTPEQTMVEVMRLVTMLSREGRDGHQLAFPIEGGPVLPLRVFEFADGVFVTDAVDASLVGARITQVAGHPIEEVLDLLEPLVPRDSPATVPGLRPFYLLRADVLEGLGLVEGDASIEVTLERPEGVEPVELETISFAEYITWGGPFGLIHLPERDGLRFTDFSRDFWTEVLDENTALYVRLTQVSPVPTNELEDLRDQLADPALTRVIFDLRHNPGGDNTTYPFLRSILRDTELPLWVLTDRRTFSAASNLATELEQSRETRFAGEAGGGGLNFWNDVRFVDLEHLPIPMRIGISTRYWLKSLADDPRLTIDPDLPVEYLSADYFAGRDATLEAVLSAP